MNNRSYQQNWQFACELEKDNRAQCRTHRKWGIINREVGSKKMIATNIISYNL